MAKIEIWIIKRYHGFVSLGFLFTSLYVRGPLVPQQIRMDFPTKNFQIEGLSERVKE